MDFFERIIVIKPFVSFTNLTILRILCSFLILYPLKFEQVRLNSIQSNLCVYTFTLLESVRIQKKKKTEDHKTHEHLQ